MSETSIDLEEVRGYLVADRTGHLVGKVECAMQGPGPDKTDALAVRPRRFSHRRLIVPRDAIGEIDAGCGVLELTVDRRALRQFL